MGNDGSTCKVLLVFEALSNPPKRGKRIEW